MNKHNLSKNCFQGTHPTDFCITCSYVTTNGFALKHDESLQTYFCTKRGAKNDFLKYVETTVVLIDNAPANSVDTDQTLHFAVCQCPYFGNMH